MPQNPGKRFEEDFKKSLNCFHLRLKDAAGWSNAENLRFTSSNICDFVIYPGSNVLFLAELKSTDKTSKAYTDRERKQLDDLLTIKEPYVLTCHIINFRNINKTYIVDAYHIHRCLQTRSSVSSDYCAVHGHQIPQELKRTRYKYLTDSIFKGDK